MKMKINIKIWLTLSILTATEANNSFLTDSLPLTCLTSYESRITYITGYEWKSILKYKDNKKTNTLTSLSCSRRGSETIIYFSGMDSLEKAMKNKDGISRPKVYQVVLNEEYTVISNKVVIPSKETTIKKLYALQIASLDTRKRALTFIKGRKMDIIAKDNKYKVVIYNKSKEFLQDKIKLFSGSFIYKVK